MFAIASQWQGRALLLVAVWLGPEPTGAVDATSGSAVSQAYSPFSFAARISGLGESPGSDSSRSKGLQVIVSGLSRTGTQTVKYALSILGYKCYHSEELVTHGHTDLWLAAVANDTAGDDALRTVAERVVALGFDCVLDLTWPWSPRLLALYPEAKVLHTVRDSPEAWFNSFKQISSVFLPLHGSRPFRWLVDFEFMKKSMRGIALVPGFGIDNVAMAHPLPWIDIPTLVKPNEEPLIAAYRRQQAVMEALTPPGQFLVFNVKQGWGPLCSFLEVGDGCPQVDFPHLNQAQPFDLIRAILLGICYTYPVLPLLPFVAMFACLKILRWLLRHLCCPAHGAGRSKQE